MPRRFLGKPHPEHQLPPRPRKADKSQALLLRVIPVFLVGSTLYVGIMARLVRPTTPTTDDSFAVSAQRDLGGILAANRQAKILANQQVGAQAGGQALQASQNADPCRDFQPTTIFPLIPSQIAADPNNPEKACSPPFWNLRVFMVMAYKLLGLLNWAAGALAVMLTVYAGILYLLAFSNEANTKKAKSVLVATYVGLAIVFSARLIVYGVVQHVIGGADPTQQKNIQDANRGVTGGESTNN